MGEGDEWQGAAMAGAGVLRHAMTCYDTYMNVFASVQVGIAPLTRTRPHSHPDPHLITKTTLKIFLIFIFIKKNSTFWVWMLDAKSVFYVLLSHIDCV